MAAVTSVTNRFTGLGLSVGITGIAALSLVPNFDLASLVQLIGNHDLAGPVGKFAVSFVLIYHYCGGIRHLVWDYIPENTVNNDIADKSSYLLLALPTIAAGALAFVSI